MLKIYPDKYPDHNKLLFTNGRFFRNHLISVNTKSDNSVLSSWSDSVDASSCFVVATPEKSYHFMAETEDEQR